VDGKQIKEQVLERVAEIYNWIDEQIVKKGSAETCDACGKCCDFEAFGHKLYVTTLELMYLAANLPAEDIRAMNGGVCPYNSGGKCSIYDYRFSGCRIFNCKGDIEFQGRLSEAAVGKFKAICEEFDIPYSYKELFRHGFAEGEFTPLRFYQR